LRCSRKETGKNRGAEITAQNGNAHGPHGVTHKHVFSDKNVNQILAFVLIQSYFKTLSTLPDYVLYRHAGLVFPGNASSASDIRLTHSIRPLQGKESIAKCITDKQILPSQAPQGPLAVTDRAFASSGVSREVPWARFGERLLPS
jgi:hypothetical protein